jgi:N-acetylglutamate synthase
MPVVLADVMMGQRVVIRYVRRDDRPGPPLSDVVGDLIGRDAVWVRVRSRHGIVTVPIADIVAAKVVTASRRAILDLEATAMRGWRAAETAELDGWTLRADPGGSRRANSAIPLVTGARAVSDVLPELVRWYAVRGLPPLVSVALPARELLDAELARLHWRAEAAAIVMTRPMAGLELGPVAVAEQTAAVQLSPTAQDDWFTVSHGPQVSEQTQLLLSRHPRLAFAAVRVDGEIVGVGRGAIDDGWLGITSVQVLPAARRRGTASSIVKALVGWAVSAGATRCYLQVEADNAAAVELYRRLGFTEHHRYHYRRGLS